jgi:hypothetical protein
VTWPAEAWTVSTTMVTQSPIQILSSMYLKPNNRTMKAFIPDLNGGDDAPSPLIAAKGKGHAMMQLIEII